MRGVNSGDEEVAADMTNPSLTFLANDGGVSVVTALRLGARGVAGGVLSGVAGGVPSAHGGAHLSYWSRNASDDIIVTLSPTASG